MRSVKSVRLDGEIETQLALAAKIAGISESEFIRESIRRHADQVLGEKLDARLADVVGTIRSKGGRARRAHFKFGELKERRQRRY